MHALHVPVSLHPSEDPSTVTRSDSEQRGRSGERQRERADGQMASLFWDSVKPTPHLSLFLLNLEVAGGRGWGQEGDIVSEGWGAGMRKGGGGGFREDIAGDVGGERVWGPHQNWTLSQWCTL